jgi:8-oxo-dGTP pyrophosphatase MutT (NUDIX family)
VVTRGLSLLSAQQLALVDGWDGQAVPARDAATVAVLRDGSAGRETFLLRRRATMAFAAGKYVFPGGGVQDSDFEPVPWIGPGPRTWALRLSCREDLARALVVAAVREVFEETGLLLAGADGVTATVEMGDGETGGLADDRRSVESHQLTFGAFLRARGLWLRADLLTPWAHWITPRFQPRRFDTRFFVAMLPAGQSAGVLTTESDHGEWVTIERALTDVRNGTMEMMRPTRHTLRQLRAIGARPVEAAALGRTITAIEPRLVEVDGVRYLDGPADEEQ